MTATSFILVFMYGGPSKVVDSVGCGYKRHTVSGTGTLKEKIKSNTP